MKKYIEITADTNDADYTTKRTEISDKTLKFIEPVLEAIRSFEPYTTEDGWHHRNNFPHGEYCPNEEKGEKGIFELYVETGLCTEDELWTFAELCPAGDIHSITDVNILIVSDEMKLL